MNGEGGGEPQQQQVALEDASPREDPGAWYTRVEPVTAIVVALIGLLAAVLPIVLRERHRRRRAALAAKRRPK